MKLDVFLESPQTVCLTTGSKQLENNFKEEISISPFLQGKECEKTVLEVVSQTNGERGGIWGEKTNNNNNYREIEKFSLDFFSSEADAILNAPACEEPDRAKVMWRGDGG